MGARRDEVGSPHFVLENQNHATLSVPRYCFSSGCFVIIMNLHEFTINTCTYCHDIFFSSPCL